MSNKVKLVLGTVLGVGTVTLIAWGVWKIRGVAKGTIIAAVANDSKTLQKNIEVERDIGKVQEKIEKKVEQKLGLTFEEASALWAEIVHLRLKVCDACVSAAESVRTDYQKGWVFAYTTIVYLSRSLNKVVYVKATEGNKLKELPAGSKSQMISTVTQIPSPVITLLYFKYSTLLGWSKPAAGLFDANRYLSQAWDSIQAFDKGLNQGVEELISQRTAVANAAMKFSENVPKEVLIGNFVDQLNSVSKSVPPTVI